jgi:hypothetical protein
MPTFPNAELLKKVLPQRAANAPRMVNFTGVPEGMGGNDYYGLGLGGIDDMRQKLAQAASSSDGLAQVHEPFGVAGYGLGKLGDVMREHQAMSAERATRDTLAGIIGGIDPTKGPTMEQVQSAFEADPGYGQKLYEQLVASQNQEHWEPVPGQPGIQRNTRTGETKSAGEPTSGPGVLKETDVASMADDFTNTPDVKNYQNAQSMWLSLQDAATRDTAQADLNMVIGLAKLFDPTSVVRTEEGKAVELTGDLPNSVSGAFKYLIGTPGSRLGKKTRQGMLQEGYGRMNGYYQGVSQASEWFKQKALRRGYNPDDIIRPFPAPQPFDSEKVVGSDTEAPPENNPPPDDTVPDASWPPKPGDVVEGKGGKKYRFKGGDPYSRDSYEPVVGAPAGG